MWIIIVCGVLLLVGLTAGVGWSNQPFLSPDPGAELTAGEVARRFVWHASIAITTGIAAGITVVGAGGRLMMRLLAVTAGDAAQGRVTEAEEVVGAITLHGTQGFVLFQGIFFGVTGSVLFLVVRRFLPAGRLGGVVFGLSLLVVAGSVLDPLRKENPDFDLVGPGWVAVVGFTAVAIGFGLAVEGLTARASAWLPLFSTRPAVLRRYAVPAVVTPVVFLLIPLLLAIGAIVVLVTRRDAIVRMVRSRRWVIGGQVLLITLILVSLPNTISNIVDIVSR